MDCRATTCHELDLIVGVQGTGFLQPMLKCLSPQGRPAVF